MSKYTIGLDYGSLSGRAVLVDVNDGAEIASAVLDYPHGVMDQQLPDGTLLPHDWALQHPQDYLDVLFTTVPAILKESNIDPNDVIGIGVDFTTSTAMPMQKDGTPLCFLPKYKGNPHAYVKLWKHHAAQHLATRMTELAKGLNATWLDSYGGKISSEWSIPKLWQILEEAPVIYDAMDYWTESGDWLTWQMTGEYVRNYSCEAYKALYVKDLGYPPKSYFAALNPKLENVVADKLVLPTTPNGQAAGYLTCDMANKLGLSPGIAVGVSCTDAVMGIPALGIDGPGKLLAIMGTSTCHFIMDTKKHKVPGMCAAIEDGVLPGYFSYEAGQSCVGDHFAWLVKHTCPKEYYEQAENENKSIHQYLTQLANQLKPGESGLLALDWWNGNRSILVDVDLTGMMLGMTLQTTAPEMYRALIEATAYGTRMIVDNFNSHGVAVNEFYASGGISQKNSMAMQIYADVLNIPVKIAASTQASAAGTAIFAAVAAGEKAGGYDDIFKAIRTMGKVSDVQYKPIPENVKIYEQLYQEYANLHDYFGRGGNDVMKHLKALKKSV